MCDIRCTQVLSGSSSAYRLRSGRGGRLASLRLLCPCFCGGFSTRKKSCAKIYGAIRNIRKRYAIASFHSSCSSHGARFFGSQRLLRINPAVGPSLATCETAMPKQSPLWTEPPLADSNVKQRAMSEKGHNRHEET